MGGVHAQHIHLLLHQQPGALQHVGADAHGGGTQQTAVSVLGGEGVFDVFLDVLDGDQAPQGKVFIHNRQLFNPVGGQQFFGVLQCGANGAGHQVFAGHHVADQAGVILFKAQVPVGEDAHQAHVGIGDGDAGDAVPCHQRLGV